ncbi:MAG: hypothetical protein IPL39_14225 [Opitutaceae bacterium]|nr:hypothetical protein [Opitutaceae bacterium]
MIGLTKITNYLLDQQLRRLGQDFIKEGGLRQRPLRRPPRSPPLRAPPFVPPVVSVPSSPLSTTAARAGNTQHRRRQRSRAASPPRRGR